MDYNTRILIVDDLASIHEDFVKILTPSISPAALHLDQLEAELFNKGQKTRSSRPTFTLASAYQGEEAINLVKLSVESRTPYAVAFVDVLMPPGKDGVETITEMWEIDPCIQTVICTAYAKYSSEEILNRFGQTDRLFILKKPFDQLEVVQLACALTKKWNTAYAVKMMRDSEDSPGTQMEIENSLKSLNETMASLGRTLRKF